MTRNCRFPGCPRERLRDSTMCGRHRTAGMHPAQKKMLDKQASADKLKASNQSTGRSAHDNQN